MQSFQKPLSKQEERYYIDMLRTGNTDEKEKARQILIERNLRLVAHVVKKYQSVGEDAEDLISIGSIGLIKAIETYDGTKGSRLATYAARCIDNELLMMLRARKKSSRDVSIYEPIGTDKEGNEIQLLDLMLGGDEDFANEFQKKEDLKKVRHLVSTVLPPREKEIIALRYGFCGGKELTQREIGVKLGISRSYVSRIEKKALEILREAFGEDM